MEGCKQPSIIFRVLRRGDPYGIRTHVTAVKGRCLNHLTNGPNKNGGDCATRTRDLMRVKHAL